jgi:uncharacterized membrane protein
VSLERRHEITRLEAFSDAVFAFALTLLVVSLEVPRSYHELMTMVRGFVPFAACFALLVWIWYEHAAFFGRYAIQDSATVVLNAALLFVVLFYVYPLKYVMNVAFLSIAPQAGLEPPANDDEVARLFVVYGLGYMAVFVILALLYGHALTKRHQLALTPLETFDTHVRAGALLLSAGVGMLSVLWALAAPRHWRGLAGPLYFLMAPVQTFWGMWTGRRRRRLGIDPQAAPPPPQRASAASEPRERSAPAQRRASERVGGSGGAKPPGQ